MDFSSDANANFEGLLAVHRGICIPQMAEKTSPDAPPNCTAAPLSNCRLCQVFYTGCGLFIVFRGKSGYHTGTKRDEERFG
jgi:hypothetical protein